MASRSERAIATRSSVAAPNSLAGVDDRNGTTALTGSSQTLNLPKGSLVVRIASTGNFWYSWGYTGAAAVATASVTKSSLFPAGVEQIEVPLNSAGKRATSIAVLQVAGTDTGPVVIDRLN